MKHLYTPVIVLAVLLMSISVHSQNIQLFAEDFNGAPAPMSLNADPTFPNTGPNRWIINNQYTGAPTYPNTTRQDSIQGGGTIAGAPYSNYLHIHDQGAVGSGISNSNYNPNAASDVFAAISQSICTKSIFDVKLSFFWLAEGNANAYGEVYYSRNGGPWTKTGQAEYRGQRLWRYEVVSNPAFDNAESIRFGFRWVNTGSSGPASLSFSIDDIIVVGTIDLINNPVSIRVTNVIPNPVCRGSTAIVFFEVTDTLCAGTYRFSLSNAAGQFPNVGNLGVLNINNPHTTFVVGVGIPPGTPADTCYKIRVDRVSPAPALVGIASACFAVIDCPNIITTRQPVVLMDPDTICIGSVIDVPFNSTGVYNPNNVYTAQLSDTNGSFANPFTLGSVPDPRAYPAMPPGSVSGMIPLNVPPGCGYFIRVNSSSPPVTGSLYGPFCIRECDLTTNGRIDIHVCIFESVGDTGIIKVDINTWNNNQQYFLGNKFEIEVRNSMNFGLVNRGLLGLTIDTTSGSFVITIPPLPQLLALGMMPGMYYIRIVADSSSIPYDNLGSLIRLTIGAPSEIPAIVTPIDSFICLGTVGGFRFTPFNPNSQYEWQSPNLNNGQPLRWPGNQLLINFTGFVGTFRVRVREINFGCYGPWSEFSEIGVLTPPDVNVIGGRNACLGDTIEYRVPFQDRTYYGWDPSAGGRIIDTTNNVAKIVWDSIGTFYITIQGLNKCGLDFGFHEVTVWPYPEASAPDDTICIGQEAVITAQPDSMRRYFWLQGTNIVSTSQTLKVSPTSTQQYVLFLDNAGGCIDRDTVMVYVEVPEVTRDTVTVCYGLEAELDAGRDNVMYLWSTGAESRTITVLDEGNYSVWFLDPNEICDHERVFTVIYESCPAILEVPNAFTPNGDGLNDRFGPLGQDFTIVFFRIYNRWGELLFETSDHTATWDGTFKSEPCDQGVYTWVINWRNELDEEKLISGNVTLIR